MLIELLIGIIIILSMGLLFYLTGLFISIFIYKNEKGDIEADNLVLCGALIFSFGGVLLFVSFIIGSYIMRLIF